MNITEIFEGNNSKVDQIITITERIKRIDDAIDRIKYNNDLFAEVPDAVKTLAAARDSAIAELKTL